MAKKIVDKYVNRALINLTMSAANTRTFQEIRFGIGIFQGVALVLHRIDVFPGFATHREVVTAADSWVVALTTSDQVTNLNVDQQAVLFRVDRVGIGVAVANETDPIVHDLSTLPGGGLIMPANPIYLAGETTGAAAASVWNVVLYHTFLELSDSDYLELIQGTLRTNV